MKNIKILFALLTLTALWSCDPLEDDIKEFNEQYSYVKDVEYELTDDDYSDLYDEYEVAKYGNFNNEDEAKEYIPYVLSDVFPALGEGSSAKVTYKLYNGSSPYLGDQTMFTVTEQEYLDLGYNFKNFDDLSTALPKYAEYKVADPSNGDYLTVTFDFYSGNTGFVADSVGDVVYTVPYGWQFAWPLPEDSYGPFFDESGIDFSTKSEGIEEIPVYLNEYKTNFVDEGAVLLVKFNFDDRDNDGDPNTPALALYIFDGTEWLAYGDAYQVTDVELNFGHDGETWVPDNTIKYTLNSTTDVDVIVNDGTAGDASALANLAQFRNFNLNNWSYDQIYAAIGLVLKNDFPNSEVGQKYLVTFSTYPEGDKQVHLILNGDGNYELVNE